jgi:hypothetical protein
METVRRRHELPHSCLGDGTALVANAFDGEFVKERRNPPPSPKIRDQNPRWRLLRRRSTTPTTCCKRLRKRFPLDAEHRDGPIRGVAGSPLPEPAPNPVASCSFEVSARRTAHRPCAWGIIDGLRSYRGKTINSAGAQIQIRNSESKTAISDKNFLAVREDAAAAAARGIPARGPLPRTPPARSARFIARCRDVIRPHVLRSRTWGPRRPTRN